MRERAPAPSGAAAGARPDGGAPTPGGTGPHAAALLGVALLALVAWAIFASGATALADEARIQIAVAAVALVTLAALLFSPRVRLRAPMKALAALGLLVLFAAWVGGTMRWSIAPDLTWVQLNRWATYAVVVALGLVLGSSIRRAPERAALGFLAVASLAALYALGGKTLPWVHIPGLIDLDEMAGVSRLRAPLGYGNALALVCVLAAPVAVRLAADPARPRRLRAAAVVALLLLLVTLGLTYSRGGILALLVAFAILIAIGPDRLRLASYGALGVAAALPAYAAAIVRDDLTTDGLPVAERADDGALLLAVLVLSGVAAVLAARRLMAIDGRLRLGARGRRLLGRRTAVAGVAAIMAVAVGALAISGGGVTGTLEREWRDFRTTKYDPQDDPARVLRTNSGNRWVWWREAVGAFWDEPLRGWGAGSFPLVHRLYRDDELEVRQAHSVPLQLLAETGAVGAALALGGLGLLGWAAIARLRLARPRERRYVAALLAAAGAWGVHMWFDWDSDIPGVTLPLLVALGVLAARPPGEGAAVEAAPPPDYARVPLGPRAAGLAAGALVLAALAVSAYLPWQAEEKTAQARLLLAGGAEAQLVEAAKRAREAARLNPVSVEPVFAQANVAYRRGRYGEVSAALEEAVERQPRNPQVWLYLYIVQGQAADDLPARLEAIRRLTELDPQALPLAAAAVAGDLAAMSATATGTPLVDEVPAPVAPPIGPPAPGSRPLIGPPRPRSSGGTEVEPPTPR